MVWGSDGNLKKIDAIKERKGGSDDCKGENSLVRT